MSPHTPTSIPMNYLRTYPAMETGSLTRADSLLPKRMQDDAHSFLCTPLGNLLKNLSDSLICTDKKDQKIRIKINEFIRNMPTNNRNGQQHLNKQELFECAKLMHKVSKGLSGNNHKHKITTHLLSKHLYNEWVQIDVIERRQKILHEHSHLTQPGNTSCRNINIGSSLGIGTTHLKALSVNGNYSIAKTTDCDDEGIVEQSKDVSLTASVGASISLTTLANLKATISGSHSSTTKGVTYTSLNDYVDSLCNKLRYRSLNSNLGRKHSVKYYQNSAFNHLDSLNKLSTFDEKKSFLFSCSTPYQDNTKVKKAYGTSISASLGAEVLPLSSLSVGASVNYTHEKKNIFIHFKNSMVCEVMTNKDDFYIKQVEKLTPRFQHALKDLLGTFDSNGFLNGDNTRLSSSIPLETLENALAKLEETIDIYCQATRGSDTGNHNSALRKHQLEEKWGIKGQGRYAFMQCAEVMLALLSNRADFGIEGQDNLQKKIIAIDNKIATPEITHNKTKLDKHVKFNKKLNVKIKNNIIDMMLNVGGSTLNNSLAPSANIHVTIKNNNTRQPGRLRAGNYKDIMIDFNAGINLAKLPDTILSTIAAQANIPVSALTTSLAQNINAHADFSLGGRIMFRYFRPSSQSALAKQHNQFSHQFTRLFVNTSASTGLSTSGLPELQLGLSAGISASQSKVVHESLGTHTLSYLLVRYNYCKGIWDQGGMQIWSSFIENHQKTLSKMMRDITNPDSPLYEEAHLLITESTTMTPEIKNSIFAYLDRVEDDNQSFEQGTGALNQLLELQRPETGRIFRGGLIPETFSKKHLLARTRGQTE